MRIHYHAKYTQVSSLTHNLTTNSGLDSGLHPAVLCYVKSRIFEDIGDLQKAQYFKMMYDKATRQYPLRKCGVRTLAVPKL